MAKARAGLLQIYLFNGGGIPFPRMPALSEWASSKSTGHRLDLSAICEQATKLPSCQAASQQIAYPQTPPNASYRLLDVNLVESDFDYDSPRCYYHDSKPWEVKGT
jgi:hypothetical protein